ncbi:TatD family hydrolase [Natrinema salsiterrestre]|uniref:TatD family hydrolase n=1 Tax=Natrinema salsiterrestre TaxID=2950540 RepID=A0A9Q4L308_9EURY|nr:TatD family hydrolase [Natrinema salsiterrestre]MDF9745933.1 TatD family hydrolase [Natrinema salsiterrestre]
MTASHPTKRPTDAAHLDDSDVDLPPELLNLPWVDIHNHAHTLSWEDRERYALAGCRSMMMVASGYHWTPYKPVEADDIRFLWDDAINRRAAIQRNHFFEAKLGLGIHTGVRIENPDELLDAMDAYCELDEVIAIGETGVTPSQHVSRWDVDQQQAIVQGQMELADEHDLPVLLHTPNQSTDSRRSYRDGIGIPGYEKNTGLGADPVIDSDNPALESVKRDIEAMRDAGLSDRRVVASHADGNNTEYLMENTDCYLSYTIGHSWLIGVTAADVADAIDEYGPERIMIDTDCANVLRTDPFALKRAIFELYRYGIDEAAIRKVVLENPRDVFDFDA